MQTIYINKEFNVLRRKLIFISFVVKEEDISNDLELIDKWLSDVLKIDLEVKNKSDSVIYEIIHRILLLSKTILQALLIPVFNGGEILEIKYDALNKQYHLRVAIDFIEYVTKNVYVEVINRSALYILTYCINNITTISKQNLFQVMEVDIF